MGSPYNILLDSPPEALEAGGVTYQMNTDFRVALAYFRVLERDDIDDSEKTFLGFQLFLGCRPPQAHLDELIAQLGAFLGRGREKAKASEGEKLFDVMIDSGRIFAAFLQVYRINLRTAKIHWWVFMELLEGLPKGTHLADVIEIRGRPFAKYLDPASRAELQRIKDAYRIRRKPSEDMFGDLFASLKGA